MCSSLSPENDGDSVIVVELAKPVLILPANTSTLAKPSDTTPHLVTGLIIYLPASKFMLVLSAGRAILLTTVLAVSHVLPALL